ncbi:MAG TPA: type II toxin-antitoxin system RelE/ParE family toxin [Gammaproteobacteria bacterium]|nr:type II toxin-antitoxin system RelE/ParE family toxin [Gammaproteobacteria bacterium]
MRYAVLLTEDAARDLEDIRNYISEHDLPSRAEHVLKRLEKVISGPKKLLALGIRDYRQVFLKPYRVVYRSQGKRVYIYLIADGWRDMQTLFARRLLRA